MPSLLSRAHDRSSLTDTNTEIEGYASLTSVNRGGSISFFVNTKEPSYTFEIFRLGWYQSTGARRMTAAVQLAGCVQTIPIPTQDNILLLECNWTNPYTITIPTNAPDADGWVSGFYFAKLTSGTSGKQVYIPFIVRDDQRASTYVYQWPCATYQAYNFWAGLSLYGNANTNLLTGRPRKVSFNRPYTFLYNYFDWESMMVSFLEREGFDVSYCSSVDVHEQPNLILNHRVFMTVGHDEYWSWPMRQNVETARDSGVSLAIFAANTCYWQVRFEPSSFTGAPDRTMVGYKEAAYQLDPFALGDPTNYPFITTLWRNNIVKPPEDALLGVLFGYQNGLTNMVMSAPSHWVCAGTGLTNGSVIPGIVGYEVDGLGKHTPLGTTLIAHSPVTAPEGTNWLFGFSDMTIYTAPSGADVFDAGTIEWTFGLDANPWVHTTTSPNRTVTRMTRNILARLARCAAPQRNMISWWAGEGNGLDELGRNAATFPQGVSFTNGMVEQAFWFGGTNQYAVVTNASTQYGVVTNASTTNMIVSQLSLDMWLMPAGPPAGGGIVFAAADTNGSPWYVVTLAGDGTLQLQLTTTNAGGSVQTTYSSGGPAIHPGRMQHLAITADLTITNQVLGFVNGAPLVLGLQSGTPPPTNSVFPNAGQFYIGGVPQLGPTNFYAGLVDEIGLYARVLATNEVVAIYNARSGGHCCEEGRLEFTTVGGTNSLSWPLAALGFSLQSTTNLSGPWTPETNAIVVNGDQFVFGFNPALGQKYFRLIKVASDTPSTPTGLSATAVSSSQINLSWAPSTDNVGVTGYRVFRDGVQIATSAAMSFSDAGLAPGTNYTYSVSAFDAAGNVSAQSITVSATTPAWTHIQTNARNSAGPTNALAFGAATRTGDLIIVEVDWPVGSAFVSLSDSQGNTYTEIGAEQASAAIGVKSRLYYAKTVTGGANTITAVVSGGGCELYIHEYSGLSTTSPLDAYSVNGANSTSFTSGTVTTTVTNELLYGFEVDSGAGAASPGWTTRSALDLNVAADQNKSAPGNAAFTGTSSGASLAWIAAFK